MSNYYFSPAKLSFYPLDLLYSYKDFGTLPSDLIEVTDEVFKEFSGNPPESKARGAGEGGQPTWVSLPEPTQDQLIQQAECQRVTLLNEAKDITGDWRTELELGIISAEDKASLVKWISYMKAIKEIDTSSTLNIAWPNKPS